MQQDQIKRLFRGGGILFFCIVTFLCAACDWQLPPTAANNGTDDSFELLRSLVYGIKANDEELLRSIIVEERWPKLEEQIKRHQDIACGFTLQNPEVDLFAAGNVGTDEKDNVWQGSVSLVLRCPSYYPRRAVYTLGIEGLILHKLENGWMVMDWEIIDESWN